MPTIIITDSGPQIARTLWSTNAAYLVLRNQLTGTVASGVENIGQHFVAGPTYTIWRRGCLFDTTVLAALGAINITGVNLQLYCFQTSLASSDFDLTIMRDAAQVCPHNPVIKEDYALAQYAGNGGSKTASTFTDGVYNNVALNPAWVINDGLHFTKLFLVSSRDINADVPTKAEWIRIGTEDSGPSTPARLEITYSVDSGGGCSGGGYRSSRFINPEEALRLENEYIKFMEKQIRPVFVSGEYVYPPQSQPKKKKKRKWVGVKYTKL